MIFPIVFIADNNNELTNHLRFGDPIKTVTKYAQLGYNATERQL